MDKKNIVSNFEIIPYNQTEFYYNEDEKCIGQLVVNKAERTITFRHISGHKPVLEGVLYAMSVQKHWCRLISDDKSTAERRGYFLLERRCPFEAYVAHLEDDGKAVIDHRIIINADYGIEEVTFTPLEFTLLFDYYTIWCSHCQTTFKRKKILRWIRKELEYRFIK